MLIFDLVTLPIPGHNIPQMWNCSTSYETHEWNLNWSNGHWWLTNNPSYVTKFHAYNDNNDDSKHKTTIMMLPLELTCKVNLRFLVEELIKCTKWNCKRNLSSKFIHYGTFRCYSTLLSQRFVQFNWISSNCIFFFYITILEHFERKWLKHIRKYPLLNQFQFNFNLFIIDIVWITSIAYYQLLLWISLWRGSLLQ